jgi:murein DD-endopeptidase MepM/ murein hydrolase activator NlpD
VYSHLSAVSTRLGQMVKQGELIGKIGSTGRSTGAHLDWRVNWFQERLDPALLVGPMPK